MMPIIEIRGDGKSVFISGYANITEKESHFLNEHGRRFKEIIEPKTWSKALSRAKDVLLLHNHQETRLLGNWKTGKQNLKLSENEIGLKVEAEIYESDIVQKVKENRSYLKGWSFGFVERSSSWEKRNGYERRLVSDLDLIEVSLLGGYTKPAYPSATAIEVRSEGILERRFTDFENKESNMDFKLYERQIKLLKLKGML
jgi:uncharacterized protein